MNINLVRAGKEAGTSEAVFEEPFNPTFTYTVFGEEEVIFGYRSPQINLRFRAHDLQPSLEFKHDGVFEAIGETKPVDILEILKEFLPEGKRLRFDTGAHFMGRGFKRIVCRVLLHWFGVY